jgi:hypothetical protein
MIKMSYRFRVYGSLLLIISLSFFYLLFLFIVSWYSSSYETPSKILQNITQQNTRWITWGACASGFGLISGILSAIGLFFDQSDEDFFLWFYEELVIAAFKGLFKNWRYISGFLVFMITIFLLLNGDLYIALWDSLELIGIVVWLVLIIVSINLIFILLADALRQVF